MNRRELKLVLEAAKEHHERFTAFYFKEHTDPHDDEAKALERYLYFLNKAIVAVSIHEGAK